MTMPALWYIPSSFSLTDPPPIIIDSLSVTDVTGCYGDSTGSIYIEASGGWNRIEYSLDGLTYQSDNLFDFITGGPKTLYIRDSLGCTVTIDTLEIDQPAQLIVSVDVTQAIGSTPGTITLTASGGTPPYVYSVDNGVNTQDTGYFGDLVPGLYDIFVQDAHGCIFTDTVRIIMNELDVLITKQDVSCYGLSDGEFIITVLNGVPPYLDDRRLPGYRYHHLNRRTLPLHQAWRPDPTVLPLKMPKAEPIPDTVIINEPAADHHHGCDNPARLYAYIQMTVPLCLT